MPKPADEKCDNCTYSVIKEDAKEYLFCQRMPPQIRIVNKTGNDITEPLLPVYDYPFPVVHMAEWCGEHKKVKTAPTTPPNLINNTLPEVPA